MLKNLLVGVESKAEGGLIRSPYPNITPQQLFANGPTTTSTLAGASGHTGAALGSGLQYADNTASVSLGLNPQLRSQIDDAIEARLQGFKRG
jgi:hypothetical protein